MWIVPGFTGFVFSSDVMVAEGSELLLWTDPGALTLRSVEGVCS